MCLCGTPFLVKEEKKRRRRNPNVDDFYFTVMYVEILKGNFYYVFKMLKMDNKTVIFFKTI